MSQFLSAAIAVCNSRCSSSDSRQGNDMLYGLRNSIRSDNLSKVHRLIPMAGTVWGNCDSMLDSFVPFGGFKQSGFSREMRRTPLGD